MKVLENPEAMTAWSAEQRRDGCRIGFVPTMGYLHEGHLSLVALARARADVVVVSIFVNPTQFGPKEDFGRYPRDFARDESLCRAAGVDAVFYPTADAMYPPGYSTYVVEEKLGVGLCGASRPGHFRGVTTVVLKLFNLVQPAIAVFGEKDAQQLRVIRRMVRDLNVPVEIVPGPTGREPDGLAMSSRNRLLTPEERAEAVWLSRALAEAREAYAAGERNAAVVREVVARVLARASRGMIDYIEVVDDETLEPVTELTRPTLLAIAVKFSATRLIDNTVLGG
jgi:pantoate--beta-alanine ligase